MHVSTKVDALFAHAPVRSFPKNMIVYGEGEPGDSVFLIHAGRVKEFLCGTDGKEADLNIFEPGEFFGEMGFDGGPRSASVITLAPTQLAVLRQCEFGKFVAANPDFAVHLVVRQMSRTRDLLKSVKSLALLDVYHRVAQLLLEMAIEENGKLIIARKLSKRDIANRVGATREMASKVFRTLVVDGYIEMENERITIARALPDRI